MSSGSVTFSGLGSGIDIEALIEQMTEIEKRPITILEAKKTIYQGQISAYQIFNQMVGSLNSSLTSLLLPSVYGAMSGTSSSPSVASLITGTTATPGKYKLKVDQVAEQQKVVTQNAVTDSNAALGTGKITISLGKYDDVADTFTASGSVDIDINSSNNTLSGIRDAINAADAGVTASIINDGRGDRLVITSDETGEENAFTIEVDPASTGDLHDLAYSPVTSDPSSMTLLQAAQNAEFSIDGIDMVSSTNTIDFAIKGLTIMLESEGETTLTITKTNSALESALTTFVEAYNELNSVYREATNYDAETDSAGALNGESSVRNFMEQIKRLVTGTTTNIPGGATNLTQIGISMQEDGSLAIDYDKLSEALDNESLNVEALFRTTGTTTTKGVTFSSATASVSPGEYVYDLSRDAAGNITGTINGMAVSVEGNLVTAGGITLVFEEGHTAVSGKLYYTEGVANKLQTAVDAALDTTSGSLGRRINSLNEMIDEVDSRISTLNERISVRMERLRAQLNSMDVFLAQMDSLSQYLSEQLSSIASATSSSK